MLLRIFLAGVLGATLIAVDRITPAHINNSDTVVSAQPAESVGQPPILDSEQPITPVTQEKPAIQAVEISKSEPEVQPTAKPVVQDPMSNRAIGEQMAQAKGWTGDQWLCLEKLWANESGWKHTVSNYQGSGAYGIAQALPASKMASHGSDYLSNPRTQIAWGLDYIAARYTTPCNALSVWQSRWPHWY